MKLPIYQVDAFASEVFEGNPAAVCPLEDWPSDKVMQNVAMENNLSETAFFVDEGDAYQLRWFTPVSEVDLCGHATLASAHVLFEYLEYDSEIIHFNCKSGKLKVRKEGKRLVMDFPSSDPKVAASPDLLVQALGIEPVELYKNSDYMVVVNREDQVRALDPDFKTLKKVDTRGIIVTAPGKETDFVSRFFAPAVGIDEDPVTGSAHTMLTPYWSEKLGKKKLVAQQISKRGGTLFCEQLGDRVELGGMARTFMQGTIQI